jgi:hypothetical protein
MNYVEAKELIKNNPCSQAALCCKAAGYEVCYKKINALMQVLANIDTCDCTRKIDETVHCCDEYKELIVKTVLEKWRKIS